MRLAHISLWYSPHVQCLTIFTSVLQTSSFFFFFFLMIRRPPRSTLFPTRRSSDLVIAKARDDRRPRPEREVLVGAGLQRSEEHTSELQSQFHLVCRLLLEKKKKANTVLRTGVQAGDVVVDGVAISCDALCVVELFD